MGRKRNMPSRKKVYEYWVDKIETAVDDNTCFKCGFTSEFNTAVERAHIESVWGGGSDAPENIHLLCKSCHKDSECWSGEVYDFWFYNHFIDYVHFTSSLCAAFYFGDLVMPDMFKPYYNKAIDDFSKSYPDISIGDVIAPFRLIRGSRKDLKRKLKKQ